jgi:hypothetical protein
LRRGLSLSGPWAARSRRTCVKAVFAIISALVQAKLWPFATLRRRTRRSPKPQGISRPKRQ